MPSNIPLLLRAVSDELAQRILPDLRSGDAIERAGLARLVLQELAADLDILAEVADQDGPALRAGLAGVLDELAASAPDLDLGTWRARLAGIATQRGVARHAEIAELRALAADIVRTLTDRVRSSPEGATVLSVVLARLGTLDHRWLTDYEEARNARQGSPATGAGATATVATEVDAASFTRYLRTRYPDSPEIRATEVVPIPGGRSKKTFFVDIAGSATLPARLVMRQDYSLRYEGTKVRDEYTPLLKLSGLGLPVPRPLLLEPEATEVGPSFILVERLEGAPPGTYFGMRNTCPGAFRDMARMLARLHRAEPAELGFTPGPAPEQSLLQLIDQYQKKWRDNATRASPLVDYAYAWARQECLLDPGTVAVVHGDAGPYNFLVKDDHLTAVLDWEFARVGDPAEDLGIVRVYADGNIDWDEFMAIYLEAGGPPAPERRIRLGMMMQYLKGTTLVAASGRNFEEGWTREFIKGASSFTGLRQIELRVAGLLRRFDAV